MQKNVSNSPFLFCFCSFGSACSHVAAVLFKVQACTELKLNKTACTSKLREWKRSRKRAYPAPLKVLDFKRPKKTDTCPKFESPFTEKLNGFSSPDPVKFVTGKDLQRLEKLREIDSKAAVFIQISVFLTTLLMIAIPTRLMKMKTIQFLSY